MAADPTPATPTPNPAPAKKPHKPGYFNHAQLADLTLAEDLVGEAQAPVHADLIAKKKLTLAWLTNFAALVKSARDKTNETGQAKDTAAAATHQATGTELVLLVALHGIQAARRQQRRMGQLETPVVEYSLAGYLISGRERLNGSREKLLQNAEALIAKAKTDNLPGYDAPAIADVQTALDDYKNDKTQQGDDQEIKGKDRLERDGLLEKINAGRLAIQHAADGVWSYTDPINAPIRSAFKLPPNRPLVG